MVTTTIDAGSVARGDRLEFWRSTVCDQFVTLDVVPTGREFAHGRVVASNVGEVQLRGIGAGPHVFDRSARLIRGADEDYYQIALAHRGSTIVRQDGRETVLRPGDFVFYDSSRPFTFLTDDDFEYTVCLYPKRLIPLPEDALRSATAIAVSGRRGLGATIPPFLANLRGLHDELGDETAAALTRTVGDLLVALVTSEITPATPDNVHLARAQAHIAEHIADRGLAPHTVAAAAAISTSYLHKLFSESGTTPAAYIREQRLQGCWQDLCSPALAHLTVTAIGARWGLPDPAHLSRLFRARFGVSPSEHRAGLGR